MVKNTKGGNKSKAIARKHIGERDHRSLRISTNDFEKFGVVTRVLGNGMFYVVTDIASDKQPQLLGHIRNKFRGRSKRDNTISLGSIVLVGLRDWENPYKNCDLLEVYDQNEVRQLMKNPSIDLSSLQSHINTYSRETGDIGASAVYLGDSSIEFAEERDFIPESFPTTAECTTEIADTSGDLVDFDEL